MILIQADKDELNFPASLKVVEALSSGDIETIGRYQKEPPLLEVLSQKHNISKERFFLEQGVIGVIHRVFDHVLPSRPSVLLPELGYPYYHRLASHHQAQIATFSFQEKPDSFSYNLDCLLEKVQQKPDIVVLIDPESPLGFSTSNNDLQNILEATPKETLVFLDQAHEGFRERHTKNIEQLVEKYPNLLIARGFSKYWGLAGLRIAYALCGKKVKEMIHFTDRYLGFDNLAQQAAIAALQSEDHYRDNAQRIRAEKNRFNLAIRTLPKYGVLETDSMSSIVTVPENQSLFLREQAQAVDIAIRHLGDYHKKLANFYRVTMCPTEETERIIDLFTSVSWLYDLHVHNSNAVSTINKRDAGYIVHRREVPCDKAGLLMGLHKVIVPPGKSVPPHSHNEQDEFFEFHSRAYIEVNGTSTEVQPGQWIKINSGDAHCIRALEHSFARFIALRFPYIHQDKYCQDGMQVIHEPEHK